VLVSDEVVFTETALAEFVAGPAKGSRDLPDLATRETPGGVPSIAPAEGEGTVEAVTGAEPAPVKKAAATKAPAAEAVTPEEAAPATAEAAAKAPAELADVADAGPDATPPSEDGTTETTEEKA
jgi:large subunit ribosomal protein L4